MCLCSMVISWEGLIRAFELEKDCHFLSKGYLQQQHVAGQSSTSHYWQNIY